MKKHFLLNSWLLLLCMIVGAGTAWAEETETIASFTISEHESWTINNAEYASAGGGYYKLISSDASIVTPSISWSDYSNITITISARKFGGPVGDEGKICVLQGEAELASYSPSSTSIVASSALSITPIDGTITISCPDANSSRGCGVQSVVIKGTKTGGSTLETSDLALTNAPISLSFDLYNNSSAQVINYTTSSAGKVTVEESDYVTTSVDEVNKTITVTPKKSVTPSVQTITVNQAADETYKAGSVTFTVTIADSTPIPTHTATFSINGVTSTQDFEEGASITFPDNPADVSGKTFVGWVTAAIDGTTDEVPEFVTSATMGNADITYYAVFADVDKGTQTTVTDELTTSTFGSPSSYGNWSGKSATDGSSAVYAGNSTTNNSDAIQIRATSPSGIVSTTSGGKVKKVSVTWNGSTISGRTLDVYGKNKKYSSAEDLYSSSTQGTKLGSIVYGTSTELTITDDYEFIGLRSNSGAMYLDNISITWSTGTPDTYSGYCTTVVAAAVEKPVITVAENPFLFSTTATITCATDGATIYYSYDNKNWAEYKATLNLTATTTIYAKATKGNDESSVEQVTATKNLAEPTVTVSGDLTLDLDGETDVEAGTLTAAVTYNEEAVEGAAVTWTSSNTNVATIDAETGAVTIKATGTVTFTATYAGNSDYAKATGTKTVTVIDSKAPGSLAKPYTVAQAIDAIDNDGNVTGVYVAGIVSQVDSYNSTYKSITYWISDDGTTTNQFEVYSGKDKDGADFSSKDDIQVGDVVVVKGDIKAYNDIYEFNYNSQLVSLKRKEAATITVTNGTEQTVDRTQNEEELTLSATANSGATVVFTIDSENTTLSEGTDFDFENGQFLFNTKKAGVIVVKANADAAGDYKAATEVTITITVIGEKEDAVIIVDNESIEYGETFTVDSEMIQGGDITVSSSNTSVASVEGLVITAKAVGTTTITVSTAENDAYKAGSESFTLTVTAPEGGTEAYNAEETTVTLDFTNNSWGLPETSSNKTAEEKTYNNETYEITISGSTGEGYYWHTSGYVIMGKTSASLTLPAFDKAVTQIDVVGRSGASANVKQNIYVGENPVSTETTGATGTNEYEIQSGYQAAGNIYTLKVTSNANTQITSIVVHFAAEPLTVTLSESGYATYCSKYPLDFTDNDKQTYRAWYVSDVSGTTVTFSEITGSVKSGTPIVLYGTPNATCKLASVASDNTLSGNMLEGTLAPTYVASDEDITYFGLSNGKFVRMADGVVKANKAYLPLLTEDIPSGARLNIVFEDGDTPTGIRSIENDQLTNGTYYNLNGQRVENMKKGLYIVNGKKVFIK